MKFFNYTKELSYDLGFLNLEKHKIKSFVDGYLFGDGCNVDYEHFGLMLSIWLLGMLVVGGIGSTFGAVAGPLFVRGIDEAARASLPTLVTAFPAAAVTLPSSIPLGLFSLVVIIFLIFEPRGIAHLWDTFKNWYRIHPFSY